MATVLDEVLGDLLERASLTLGQTGEPVARVVIAPGNSATWDDCCSGQLHVRVGEIFPTSTFPNPDATQQCATGTMAARIFLGVVRCAHTIDDDGAAPEPAEVSTDALTYLDDAARLRAAAACVLEGRRHALLRWRPLGVTGGCGGGEWELVVSLGELTWAPDTGA